MSSAGRARAHVKGIIGRARTREYAAQRTAKLTAEPLKARLETLEEKMDQILKHLKIE